MSSFPRHLPTARTPDSRQAPPLRWGILGSGWIAEQMVSTLHRKDHGVP